MSRNMSTPGRSQSKKFIPSMNVAQPSLEIEFWIAICRQITIKKTLFLASFDLPS